MSHHLKRIGVFTLTLFLSGCSTWADPPQHLKIDQDVQVRFQSAKQASQMCSDIHEEIRGKKNANIKACAYRKSASAEPVVIIPNPCSFDDVYASLLCHELAHINQMANNESVDHEGWGLPIQLAKSTREYPKFEEGTPRGANTAETPDTSYGAPSIEDASYIDTPYSSQLSRSAVPARKPLELVSFYEGNTPLQDVQRLKLRGFSRLEPAS